MRDGAAAERDRTIAELDAALRAADQKAALDDPVAIAAAKKEKADAVLAARQELADLQAQPADAFAGTGPDTGSFWDNIGEFFSGLWEEISEGWDRFTTRINEWLDQIQLGLSVAGLTPGIGNGADVVNTIISVLRGRWADAALNALAMIPVLGQGVTGAKLAGLGLPFIAKYGDEAAAAVKGLRKASHLRFATKYGQYVRRVDDFKHALSKEHVLAALAEKTGQGGRPEAVRRTI